MNELPLYIHFPKGRNVYHEGEQTGKFQEVKTLCGLKSTEKRVTVYHTSPDRLDSHKWREGRGYGYGIGRVRLCQKCMKKKFREEAIK